MSGRTVKLQAMSTYGNYRCRYDNCQEISVWHAKDNRAKYGHLCTGHFKNLFDSEKELYELPQKNKC